MEPFYRDNFRTLYQKDSQDMSELDNDSVDLLATDPPYGISFMGKDWDKALPDIRIWKECFRVLKPGAFVFVMSIPRADCLSRMIISLEDAGFMVNFTPIFWAYASGFPKAQNIGKAVDKRNGRNQDTYKPFADYLRQQRKVKGLSMTKIDAMLGTNTAYSWWEGRLSGVQLPTKYYYLRLKNILNLDNRFDELIEREEAEREVIGERIAPDGKPYSERQPTQWTPQFSDNAVKDASPPMITKASTPQAKALDGSYGGFQPKPAVEVIIVAMKPLSEKTFVDQALKNGKGITWLDDCRVPYESDGDIKESEDKNRHADFGSPARENKIFGQDNRPRGEQGNYSATAGRFPANLICSDDVLNDGIDRKGTIDRNLYEGESSSWFAENHIRVSRGDSGSFSRYFDLDKWAQFLIVPKASKSEKNKGLGDAVPRTSHGSTPRKNEAKNKSPNTHPTVKPVKLMAYLITLGSREGDVILDNFAGSGTTGVAAALLGRKSVLYETRKDYCEISAQRFSQIVLDFTSLS